MTDVARPSKDRVAELIRMLCPPGLSIMQHQREQTFSLVMSGAAIQDIVAMLERYSASEPRANLTDIATILDRYAQWFFTHDHDPRGREMNKLAEQLRAAQPPGLSQSDELRAVGEWVDAMKPQTDRWLIRSGPDGYEARIVAGHDALVRAYIEMVFGEPTAANAEEVTIQVANLRDMDNWVHADGVGPVTYVSNFEDGWIEIAKMPECSRPTKADE